MAYQAVTLAEFRTQLKAKYESVPFWTDTEALHAINETLRWWNLLTGYWKKTQLQLTTANTLVYTFSSSFVYNMRVAFGSFPLELGSLNSMNTGRPGWQGEYTTTGGSVPTRPTIWIPLGLRSLAIWPRDATGGTNLVLDGTCITPVLSAATDYIDIAESEFDALLGEALVLLAAKEAGQRFESLKQYHTEFILAASEQNSRLSASAYFRRALGLDLNRGEKPMGVGPGM